MPVGRAILEMDMDHQSHRKNESDPFGYSAERPTEAPKKQLKPEEEAFGVNKVEEEASAQAIERGTAAFQAKASAPLASDFPATNPLLNINPPADPATPVNSPATKNLTAADNDLIEKAWVEKAKAIIAQTKTDPHRQNNEINKIKADYQKKRYNRDLKINVE